MRERLIVALDVSSAGEAQKLVARIGDAAGIYKVGLQLFTAEGPALVRDLVGSGGGSFSISNSMTFRIPSLCREVSGGAGRAYA